MSEGRLTVDEYASRTKRAYSATFPADLVPLTSDLPTVPEQVATPMTPTRVAPRPPDSAPGRGRRWAVSVLGGAERVGNWDPRDEVMSVTVMGGNTLDLTEVVADQVTINAVTVMGATEIIVPAGATVDLGGFILMGGTSDTTTRGGASTMRVRIRSFGLMGGCDVRNLKPKELRKRAKKAAQLPH